MACRDIWETERNKDEMIYTVVVEVKDEDGRMHGYKEIPAEFETIASARIFINTLTKEYFKYRSHLTARIGTNPSDSVQTDMEDAPMEELEAAGEILDGVQKREALEKEFGN